MTNKTSSANMGPAGLQSMGEITKRRLLVLFLNSVTYIAFSAILIIFLGQTGWGLLETGILICFLLFLPWTVLGFWNALIGLYLLHGSKSGLYQVAPYLVEADTDKPLRLKTAIVMTLRNEDPASRPCLPRGKALSLDPIH